MMAGTVRYRKDPTMHRIVRRALLPLALGAAMLVAPVAANAATLQQGHWKLDAPGGASKTFAAQVQQPIDPDGSSVWSKKRGVIPVQFKVTETDKSSFRFESLVGAADPNNDPYNDYSNVVWTPPTTTMKVSELTSLVANYSWVQGNVHAGSLRWSINTPAGNVHVYYGPAPQFGNDGIYGGPGSGVNLLDQTDLRFDLSQVGGPWYGSKQDMLTLVGDQPVNWVGLILDSGDQRLNLTSASVNGDQFTFPASVDSSFQTNAPTATIAVQKHNNGVAEGAPDETLVSAQGDITGVYRQVDGKYIYNLDTASFNPTQQPGDYKVSIKIDGTIAGEGKFSLK
jgi:hypothetical protein